MARALPSTKRRKGGGEYDPATAAAEAEVRNSAARAYRPRTRDEAAAIESKWQRGPSNVGAMIRTNTHVPKVAVAREKIAQLRKRRKTGPA